MIRVPCSTPAGLLAAALLTTPLAGMGETATAGPNKAGASASLRIQIVIPPVMRVLENSHPAQLDASGAGDWTAQQRLVVLSNLRGGFCVSLRMSSPDVNGWRLQTPQEGGVTLSPVSDGYRLCAPRPGRYTLMLQHAFEASGNRDNTSLRWPVQTDITAL